MIYFSVSIIWPITWPMYLTQLVKFQSIHTHPFPVPFFYLPNLVFLAPTINISYLASYQMWPSVLKVYSTQLVKFQSIHTHLFPVPFFVSFQFSIPSSYQQFLPRSIPAHTRCCQYLYFLFITFTTLREYLSMVFQNPS